MSALISTALELVNVGLTLLGQKELAALDTTTETGRKMSRLFPICRDEVLRDIRPNFAKTRAIFHQVVDSEKSITGATAASPVVITSAAHGLSNGDIIAIWNVGGMTELNGKMYVIADVTTNTFELQNLSEQDVDGEDFTAYTSGGKCGVVSAAPAYGFAYRYELPTDYIFLLEINGNEALTIPHSIEGGELLADEQEISARYIAQSTTYSDYDVDTIKGIIYKLAELGAIPITNLSELKEIWNKDYERMKAQAKGAKSQEAGTGTQAGPPRAMVITQLKNARQS